MTDSLPEAWQQASLPELPPLRPDGLELFADTIYGRTPPGGELADVTLVSATDGVLRHRARIACPLGDLTLDTLTHVPAEPGPVVVALNFDGNDKTLTDFPYAKVLELGYGVLTIHYQQIEPDDPEATGVRGLFPPATWGAVAAWAWGLSRGLDIAATIPGLLTEGAVALGHSRLGKAALWAGALDERFAVTVSNASGCCGAALFRHPGGEDIAAITSRFPHWFVPSFASYAGAEERLPVDQHQLLTSIAPRRVFVASGEADDWADPIGEYLAVVAAHPAFDADGIGYHVRPGGHALLEEDWLPALAFARR